MRSNSRRKLGVEGLEARMLLAADVTTLAETSVATPNVDDDIPAYVVGDANRDGSFDQADLLDVLKAGKYLTDEPADWSEGDWNDDNTFNQTDLVLALQGGDYLSQGNHAKDNSWPDKILLPMGFESEGIERGRGHEFFLGGTSWSGVLGSRGSIYKGNLRTGEGQILVPATERGLGGLSYDARTDYIYAANGDPGVFAGNFTNQGVVIYDATSGELVEEIIIGNDIVTNDLLVTNKAVYVTDSINPALYKIPLERGGKPNSAGVEKIDMPDFVMGCLPLTGCGVGINANGLVGDFDGKELVVVNINTGVLYKVDTDSGDATPINIQGAEQLFENGDGLYMSGRTLYIMQNFQNKIAVVQLSGDLTEGTFVKNIVSGDFAIPTTITGFGDSIYAINTHFCEITTFCGNPNPADPATFQTEVVKVPK